MKHLTTILLLILSIGILSASGFDPDFFHSRSIIACFSKEAVGNDSGVINFRTEDGVVVTGLSSFDALAAQYRIVDLEHMHPYVKVPTWNDNGVYLQNIYRIKLDSDAMMDAALEALAKDANLLWAEFETINREKWVPNDPMLVNQYVHNRIRSFDAWDYTLGSYDILLAIADSGVKWNHPDLRGNIWVNPAESPGMTINWTAGTISGGNGVDAGEGGNKIDDLLGYDFFSNDNNPYQNWANNDHGTHVAGCAAAVGDNGIGVIGTSPLVSILSCKGASNTSNSTGISAGYDQIKYAAEIGADIVNASWGGPGSGAYPNSIVNYATALGCLVVTAAGNANTEHTTSYQDYPADATAALCVAATGPSDLKADFSDYGAPIDISAPGSGIQSTIIQSDGYAAYDGTSMASPIVAGVAALVKSVNPELTAAQLRQRLMDTADYIYDLNPDYEGKLGSGRVNAFAAAMFDKIPNITVEEFLVTEHQGDGDGIPNPGEVLRLEVSLNNYMDPYTGLTWLTGENVQARLRCSYPGISVQDSVASYGTLTAGSTMWNFTSPFTFSTVGTMPSEPIPFELFVTANPGYEFPYHATIPINISLSLIQAGWPYNVGGASSSSPILYNLDNDPDLEVIFGTPSGHVHAVKDNNSNTNIAGFPVSVGAAVIGSVAMADLNGNNEMDFAVCTQANNVVAFNQDGQQIFSMPAGGTLRAGPVIANLIPSQSAKVIALTQTSILNVFNADGTIMPNFPVTLGGAILAPPAVADLNGDGNLEILTISLQGTLSAINPLTGQNIAGFPVTAAASQNAIAIANLDADPQPEILVAASTNGHLYAINHDGSTMFEKNIGQQIKSSAVVADVDNNGSQEIILISAQGQVFILNADGTNLPNMPISMGVAVECTPVVARFDNSDLAGIIFGDTNGKVHSVRKDGTQSPNFPYTLGGNVKISAALADIDGDGDLDIAIPDNAKFYVIDVKRPAQEIEYACYMGSWNRSGNIYQATPNADPSTPGVQTELMGNYPNPFNPETTIRFNLQASGPVSLNIYNSRGQLVRSLVNSQLSSGAHSIVWNGLDETGRGVSSGIYYYRMQAGSYTHTRKMVLVK